MKRSRTVNPERSPYGSHWRELHGEEVYRIWLSRNEELEDCQIIDRSGMPLVLGDDEDKIGAHAAQVWHLALRNLARRELNLLVFLYVRGLTADETGRLMGVCAGRVRQIERRALSVLRQLTSPANESLSEPGNCSHDAS